MISKDGVSTGHSRRAIERQRKPERSQFPEFYSNAIVTKKDKTRQRLMKYNVIVDGDHD